MSGVRMNWRAVAAVGVLCLATAVTSTVWAGAQAEEPLANAVRTALSAAVSNAAPPKPVLITAEQQRQFNVWMTMADARLVKRKQDPLVRREFLETVWYEAKRAGLEPSLVLGLIEVESAFRKHAISSVGARGYMQVMPFWMRLIGNGDTSNLFHAQTNLRFGCVILRHYLDREQGNLFMALGRYNGSRGRAEYPNAVMAAWRKWQLPADVVTARAM